MKLVDNSAKKIASLPKSPRNLTGLESLIADSLGKIETYDEMYGPKDGAPPTKDSLNPIPVAEKTAQPAIEGTSQARQMQAGLPPHEDNRSERVQLSLPSSVIFATKLEALKNKSTAGEVAERALRQYLNLPPKP